MPRSIEIKCGAEWAPDSPFGLDVLRLEDGGRFHYENRWQGEVKIVTGRLDDEVSSELERHLAEAGFPALPAHQIPPGGSLVELTATDGGTEHTVQMDYHAALRFDGYGALLRRFDQWVNWLRKSNAPGPGPAGLVRE